LAQERAFYSFLCPLVTNLVPDKSINIITNVRTALASRILITRERGEAIEKAETQQVDQIKNARAVSDAQEALEGNF
jgi:hypothetical protein